MAVKPGAMTLTEPSAKAIMGSGGGKSSVVKGTTTMTGGKILTGGPQRQYKMGPIGDKRFNMRDSSVNRRGM